MIPSTSARTSVLWRGATEKSPETVSCHGARKSTARERSSKSARTGPWSAFQRVAQQVVAVELDQGVEVDEELEGGGDDHHQRNRAGPRARLGDPPGDDRQGPEEHLEVGARHGHPEALSLLGKEPGVAHVAVE